MVNMHGHSQGHYNLDLRLQAVSMQLQYSVLTLWEQIERVTLPSVGIIIFLSKAVT